MLSPLIQLCTTATGRDAPSKVFSPCKPGWTARVAHMHQLMAAIGAAPASTWIDLNQPIRRIARSMPL
jgi:hypothetical protein